MPDISVCIATYNGEKYISRQLDSILNQDVPVNEIIISDDSSTDSTLDIIRAYDDKRITILENNKFNNPIFNFENALNHVSGTTIFLSDQDDIWLKNKTQVMLELLTDFLLIVSDCSIIDEEGRVIADSFFQLRGSGRGIIKNIYKNSYLGCCMAFRRTLLDLALPFPSTIPMHDMWLGLIAEIQGNTFFCTDKLVQYRRHGNNSSSTGDISRFSSYAKLKFRYNLIRSLLLRCTKF